MRHHALFRRFISALTRGGPGGLPRPIEVHAHDPLRYVGDMLGWLHQVSAFTSAWINYCYIVLKLIFHILLPEKTLASERELVLALLEPDAITETGPTAQHFSKGSESDLAKTEPGTTFVLDRIFEGACRPFKIRVEQVLQSQPSLIISYKLSNTLEFYCYTVSFYLLPAIFVFCFPFNYSCACRFQICWGEKQLSVIHFGY